MAQFDEQTTSPPVAATEASGEEEAESQRPTGRIDWKKGEKPKMMVGRRDPALAPPPPALTEEDGAASDGDYDYCASGPMALGRRRGEWAALCCGGLFEGLPKQNTHRVFVKPQLFGRAQKGFRGAPERSAECVWTDL